MTEKELYELIEDYHAAHRRMWVEWAKNVKKERGDLGIFQVRYNETSGELTYKDKPIFQGCFLCELASMEKSRAIEKNCAFCVGKISYFFHESKCGTGSLYDLFYSARIAHNESDAMRYALDIAGSIRPVGEIFENLKHICKPEKWVPDINYGNRLSELDTENSKRMFNRMWFYKAEFDSNFVPDWGKVFQRKCFPACEVSSDYWYVNCTWSSDQRPGLPYFSEGACIELVDKLNSGEVEF